MSSRLPPTAPWADRSLEQLARNQATLAELRRQAKRLRRLDHWWNPLRYMVRDVRAEIAGAQAHLEQSDALLRAVVAQRYGILP